MPLNCDCSLKTHLTKYICVGITQLQAVCKALFSLSASFANQVHVSNSRCVLLLITGEEWENQHHSVTV